MTEPLTLSMSVSPDSIPLAGASVALGRSVNAGRLMADRGTFPVPVYRRGRYRECSRAEVAAGLLRRPHLTQEEHTAVMAALANGQPIMTSSNPAVAVLSAGPLVTATAAAKLLAVTPARLRNAVASGELPVRPMKDPGHPTRKNFRSEDLAAHLVSVSPEWPSAERLSAVPELDLDGVRRTLGKDATDVTIAYLRARDTISLADYALAAGLPLNTVHARAQRGLIEFVPAPAGAAKQRVHRRVPSVWAAAQLGLSL